MAFCTEFARLRPSPADVQVVMSDGTTISAHSSVLAAASPVLEEMIINARHCTVRILGAAPDAVLAFLRFLYSHPREETAAEWAEDAVGAHGEALLALAHAYRVPWLKRRAEAAVAARLTAERAVDALKLAALCDAPRLYLACARLAGKDLDAVERTEGWRFAGRHDAALQLELLHLIRDADQRKERWVRELASQHVYRQLSDAMALLDRVFAGGTDTDGRELEADASSPCDDDAVRRGVEQLVRHLAACGRRATRKPAACPRCRRAVQLLRLHAALCDRAGEGDEPHCTVPLCSNLKTKMQEEGVDKTWRLLLKKVTRARVMSTLSNREVPEIVKKSWAKYNSRRTAKLR